MSDGSEGRVRGQARGPRPNAAAAAAAKAAQAAQDFWGSAESLPPVRSITVSPDASAVLRSLGRPPFAGREALSEYYLRAVCENTVKLAEALATAGDLLSQEPRED